MSFTEGSQLPSFRDWQIAGVQDVIVRIGRVLLDADSSFEAAQESPYAGASSRYAAVAYARSSNGRTSAFGAENGGSNPPRATHTTRDAAESARGGYHGPMRIDPTSVHIYV